MLNVNFETLQYRQPACNYDGVAAPPADGQSFPDFCVGSRWLDDNGKMWILIDRLENGGIAYTWIPWFRWTPGDSHTNGDVLTMDHTLGVDGEIRRFAPAHVEGYGVGKSDSENSGGDLTASGNGAHVEGYVTQNLKNQAISHGAHAEGSNTTAGHTGGEATVINTRAAHVLGGDQTAHVILAAPNAVPDNDDEIFWHGSMQFYLDEASSKLLVKVFDSDGTELSGEVASLS